MRSPWIAPLAFAAGGSLTALALAVAFHNGAFDAVANTRPLPVASATVSDQRLDRLLSLLAAERDCDSECLTGLRAKADKSTALEQVLGQMQESAAAAEQRTAVLETEKAGLTQEMTRKLSDLEATHRQQVAALETEKSTLTGQMSRTTAELDEFRKRAAALQEAKTDLAARMERKTAELEAGYKQHLEEMQKRLAESRHLAESEPSPAAVPPPRKERTAARKGETPRPAPVAQTASTPDRARSATAEAGPKKWTVLGMTASTVVVSTPNHRVVALAVGESMDGIKVNRIDLDQGIADTSAGILAYRQ